MKLNKKLIIYWTFNDIKDDFNIKLNERIMTTILIDIRLMMMNLWIFKRWSMTFILNIQEKRTKKQYSCKHEYSYYESA